MWTDEEIGFLKKHYKTLSDEEIAERLNKTTACVRATRMKLGLKKMWKWSREEIEFLRQNYRQLSDSELAEKLGRSEYAVAIKRRQLGLLRKETGPFPKYLRPLLSRVKQK